jgi:citrate synthase
MGFGHRIYKVRDPRADVLKAALEKLKPSGEKLALARAVEKAALAALKARKPDRPLETNVEFYTAMLLDGLAMPRSAFTPLFAMGRIVGWTAHALEQQRIGRLIRPASLYIGREPEEAA